MIPSKISLLVVDALRYDCINYLPLKNTLKKDNVLQYLNTPTLDELCKESVCFTNCYSTAVGTSQVIASMFTGTTPINHGITHNSPSLKLILNQNTITLAEILKKLGYLTIIAGDPPKHLKSHQVFRGFDFEFTDSDEKLFKFLNEHKDDKVFLFCLFEDVHAPYLYSLKPPYEGYNNDIKKIMEPIFKKHHVPFPDNPFNAWRDLFQKDESRKLWFPLYVQGVSKFDSGRFQLFINELKKASFLDRGKSLLVLTADHGEGKCFHSKPETFTHGGDAYDDNTKVPLIVRLPELNHEIRNDLVSNVDVFRIILDLCTEKNIHEYVKHKLYCVNPFHEKRLFNWFIFSVGLNYNNFKQYRLYVRTIITKNKKFSLRGKPEEFLNPDVFEDSDIDFVKKLYANFYISDTTEKQIKQQLTELKNMTKKKLYEKLYEKFLKNGKKVPKCFVFDLENDPLEENPLDPFSDKSLSYEYLKWFKQILEIDRPDVATEISNTKLSEEELKEEEEIKKELEKLGYL